VEHHPVNGHLGLENLSQVPRNRFPFAVFVRREIKVFSILKGRLQKIYMFLFVSRNDVQGLKVMLDVYPKASPGLRFEFRRDFLRPSRQVPNVTDGGFHLEIAPEDLGDRLRFRWRFDDY
jgi:hypothetical protein